MSGISRSTDNPKRSSKESMSMKMKKIFVEKAEGLAPIMIHEIIRKTLFIFVVSSCITVENANITHNIWHYTSLRA